MTFCVRVFEKSSTLWLIVFLIAFFSWGCSKTNPTTTHAEPRQIQRSAVTEACNEEAKKALGPDAEFLKCGDLVGSGREALIAVVRVPNVVLQHRDIPVSRVFVAQRQGSEWVSQLEVDNQIRNAQGYIGIDFIDDSFVPLGWSLEIADARSDGSQGLTLRFSYLNRNGAKEGIPIEVSWNPSIGRFQEYSQNEDPGGFKPEIKNPPHKKAGKS